MKEEHKVKGRRILNPLIRLAIRLKISANMLTLASLPAGILAGYFFSQGHRWWGALFVVMIALMDTIDGEVARQTNRISKFGAFLDSVSDRLAEFFIYFGFFLYYTEAWIQTLIFVALVASLLVSYVRARAEGIGEECKIGFMERPIRMVTLLFGIFILGYKYLPISFALIFIGSSYTVVQRILYVIRKR